MIDAKLVRATLWLTAPFNLIAAFALAFPASAVGQFAGVPPSHPLYTALAGVLVALFGLTYAWMASRRHIDRPLLAFSAIGKTCAFVVTFLLWLSGEVSARLALAGFGDLCFAALWFAWLYTTRSTSPPRESR